jgi:hypothetical protein
MITAVHVTHEAVRKVGGIGAVLEGLITIPAYQKEVQRTILVGPLFDDPGRVSSPLGQNGRILFSSLDNTAHGNWHSRLAPVCRKFGAGIVYGTRGLRNEWSGQSAEVEVLLVDVANMYRGPVDEFKGRLHDKFGLHSDRYEYIWDYEQYVRLALPAFEAVGRLLDLGGENRVVVIAHEYMGVPTALRTLLAENPRLSTVFYAHEVGTVRRIVEEHPAHDTMFYNAMRRAREEGLLLQDVFGSQENLFKHGIVCVAHHCDSVLSVGQLVREELRFLSESFDRREIDLVPNGVPAVAVSREERERSKSLLCDYANALSGWRPSWVFSRVARLVMSKAFWRDIHVLRHLDRKLADRRQPAVFFLLGTEGAQRTAEEVRRMEADYGWPWNHRVGYPDLTGPEIGLDHFLQDFNRWSRAVKIVFVNQFGWERSRCGERMPEVMTFADLRKGSDVEFGQSVYEPFGISQFEPLTFGAICVPTNICGCVAFATHQSGGTLPDNIVVADYISPAAGVGTLDSITGLAQQESDRILEGVSREVSSRVLSLLDRPREEKEKLARDGYDLATRMSWDAVVADFFLPAVRRSLRRAEERRRITACTP